VPSLPPIVPASTEPSAANARWLALDVFRALAVLWMIQGHTFTALLGSGDVFGGAFGQIYRLLHGLTAPMFLCGAGLSYGIVTFGATKPPGVSGRLLRRALMLFAIGTILQLPAAPLAEIIQRRELLAAVLQPAALQLVAACLVLAELLRTAKASQFAVSALVVSVVVALLAPWIWNISLSSRYLLGSWIDGQTGAQFPLVPWVSFFLIGAAISARFGASLWRKRARMPLIGLLGLALSALCYWQFSSGHRLHSLYGAHPFWLTSPIFVVFRVGLVLAWLAALSAASPLLARSFAAWPSLRRLIAALSRHSLVAYVVHLSMLYGLPLLRGPRATAPHFSLLECTGICALVLLVSVLSVLNWERLRELVTSFARRFPATKRPPLSSPLAPPGAAPRDPLV
jgi:uncharacterized membrane protein